MNRPFAMLEAARAETGGFTAVQMLRLDSAKVRQMSDVEWAAHLGRLQGMNLDAEPVPEAKPAFNKDAAPREWRFDGEYQDDAAWENHLRSLYRTGPGARR